MLASGARALGLSVPGEARLLGHGLSTCATCDGFFFRGQEIAVVGGGDSAMEEALFLTRFATKVTVVHRRDELRASRIMQQRAFDHDKIEFRWNTAVTEVLGEDAVRGLAVRDTVTGAADSLDVTGVFVAIGHEPNTALVRGQLDLDDARLRAHHVGHPHERGRRLRRRRRPGPRLPPGDHRGGLGVHGRDRRGALAGVARPLTAREHPRRRARWYG